MIKRFEAHTDDQYKGRIGQPVSQDTSIKNTTDLVVSGEEHWMKVLNISQRPELFLPKIITIN